MIQEIGNKWKSTFPDLVRQSKKLDPGIDGKLPDDINSMPIFSKIIGHKLSDGSTKGLYIRCRMNFDYDPVKTQNPQFMDLGFLNITQLDEISGLITPATRVLRPKNGSHWSTPNQLFCETSAVGMSEAKSDYDYNYETEFQIWK